ncbi:MAG: hypothetical protein JWR51_4186 [Devosia sp.]|uniref:hypothetical protein n=1 Tax=Devosia sp. TaxID=1871048 RepID=UPI00262A70F7|nr:hypothetical protein [Devosia sp.]MDB5531083.1 hypothetical protein [Devosia sp.]
MPDQTNRSRPLCFSDGYISAVLFENVENLEVSGIVVNLSPETIWIEGVVNAPIQRWRSTTITAKKILKADRIAVLKVERAENLGGVMHRGWSWFGDIFAGFPRETPLYVSSIDTIGTVEEDPRAFTREVSTRSAKQTFELKLKLWWSPAQTDAFIHNEHPFLETHTQIHGFGRMQKFRERDAATVYEDVIMSPGFSHEAFCLVTGPNQWTYPWHRYYADTDAVWLAVELHP